MRKQRPDVSDYHEYYRSYVDRVPEGDITVTIAEQWVETRALLDAIPADREEYRYAPGKWSVREVVGHLIDVERLFAFRALWFARGANSPLPAMEQDEWAETSNAGARGLADLTDEWDAARASSIRLFNSFDATAWMRTGIASGYEVRVRALPWMLAGHELHHRALLHRDYLGSEG
jgi:uncharacterized damage-inducible protein DinB